mgnify:FL=1|tara:strand:+ start:352 stop:507 length:156 start_codon:yes stop_codon:yes gene_type:complete
MPYGYTDNADKSYTIDTGSVRASRKAFKAGNITDKAHIKNLWNAAFGKIKA